MNEARAAIDGRRADVRAALYLRQSKSDAEGIDRQRERAAALAAARGWAVVATFIDDDVSASKSRGPNTAWGQMLAQSAGVDVVVSVDLDRLVRSTQDLNVLIEHGIMVATVDGEIDLTTADGEFRASMLASIARFEVRRKGERQRRANERRAANGEWIGTRRTFGYEMDGTIREAEAAAVRDGFKRFLEGESFSSIARAWNEAGFVTTQPRQARSGHAGEPSPWRRDSVRSVLMNPRYAGRVRFRGEVLGVDGRWPAIVDDAVFEAVQAIAANPARRRAGRQPVRLLTGIAVCGVCGATVHGGGGARAGVPGYRCSASTGHVARMAAPVDEFVSAVVLARLSRPDAADLTLQRPSVSTEGLRAEATGLRARADTLAVEFADGVLTSSQLRAATARIRERLAEIESTLADAGKVDALGPLVQAEDVRAAWDSLSVERRRLAVKTLMRVTVHPPGRGTRTFRPETITIEWNTDTV